MSEPNSNALDALLKKHKLTRGEYEKIQQLLGRDPNLTELGIFSVMWSEHCSYKSSKVHLKKLPTRSERVLQGPGENAGIIDIGEGYAIAFKIESHNHPSFIEPFQGAATGVGGILRDIFTMGARPIAVMDAIRFGPLDSLENGARNRRILDGVVQGISHYGNCFGVPTVGGETVFEDSYDGNPLVNVFALGVFRHDEIFYGRATGVGNPVIYVGARTGRDGIHGASMASDVFTEASQQQRPTVQVGDPFMEKLLLEACLEAMRTGAVVGIQDMGAAGLTCSTSEMGSRAGTGIDFDLKHVPQRETGMTPYEIMLSESQERMLLVAEKGREGEILAVFDKWGLESAVIGTVTDDGMLRVRDNGVVVAEIRNRDLADEAPLYHRPYTKPYRTAPYEAPEFASSNLEADLLGLMGSADLCSKRWIWEQYDYMVQTNTLAGPGGDAAIVRIKETGISVAMSLDGNGRYCYLDPREGAKLIVAECCRNLSAVGALPVSATNNLNFGNPERPEIMAQLVEGIEGLAEACAFFDTPITGGNVSLYNETLGESIFPTPVVGIVGLLGTAPPVGMKFPAAGLDVLLIGGLGQASDQEMGGTQYAKQVLKSLWGVPPKLDMEREKAVQAATREVVVGGLARAAHDLGEGGIAVALAEASLGGVGAEVSFESGLRPEIALYHEGPSRVLIATERRAEVEAIAARHGVEALWIGRTVEGLLKIRLNSHEVISVSTDKLHHRWDRALEEALHV
ncbi:MAG: phosphoribosylformylglycinamidine synthase subunit PurL [Bryobacter sp.]|jgi:phosphoribosylformylglycinamidine synthase|nr:phosphoribosylformylglycinamidine synthase subunit PurL [Bryobacter sp. CoA8 C33]